MSEKEGGNRTIFLSRTRSAFVGFGISRRRIDKLEELARVPERQLGLGPVEVSGMVEALEAPDDVLPASRYEGENMSRGQEAILANSRKNRLISFGKAKRREVLDPAKTRPPASVFPIGPLYHDCPILQFTRTTNSKIDLLEGEVYRSIYSPPRTRTMAQDIQQIKKNCVVLYGDGKNTLFVGWRGLLHRWKGFVLACLASLAISVACASSIPFWWPKEMPKYLTINIFLAVFLCFVVILVIITIAFFYSLSRAKRSLNIKAQLHTFSHHLRDGISKPLQRAHDTGEDALRSCHAYHEETHLRTFSNVAANIISDLYGALVRDDSVGCAIRLAAGSNDILYHTVGRSRQLNLARENTTEPLAQNEGIPNFFMKAPAPRHGVLFFYDIKDAIAQSIYTPTKNHISFETDFSVLLVAPLNGWNGQKMDLIGLLCITSKRENLLNATHVDFVRFLADSLAGAYTSMLWQYKIPNPSH